MLIDKNLYTRQLLNNEVDINFADFHQFSGLCPKSIVTCEDIEKSNDQINNKYTNLTLDACLSMLVRPTIKIGHNAYEDRSLFNTACLFNEQELSLNNNHTIIVNVENIFLDHNNTNLICKTNVEEAENSNIPSTPSILSNDYFMQNKCSVFLVSCIDNDNIEHNTHIVGLHPKIMSVDRECVSVNDKSHDDYIAGRYFYCMCDFVDEMESSYSGCYFEYIGHNGAKCDEDDSIHCDNISVNAFFKVFDDCDNSTLRYLINTSHSNGNLTDISMYDQCDSHISDCADYKYKNLTRYLPTYKLYDNFPLVFLQKTNESENITGMINSSDNELMILEIALFVIIGFLTIILVLTTIIFCFFAFKKSSKSSIDVTPAYLVI